MSLADATVVVNDPEFRDAVAAQLERTAMDIYNEDESIAGHTARARLAQRVLMAPNDQYLVSVFTWAITTNDTVIGKWVADDHDGAKSDLAFTIASVFDAIADAKGVMPTA